MKYRLMALEFCCMSFLFINAHGQFKNSPEQQQDLCFTGNLQNDLSVIAEKNSFVDDTSTKKIVYKKGGYRPLVIGLYSAVIPGAGQFYTKSYWQGAAFLGAEALLWVLYVNNENKGNRLTTDFHRYADEHWSAASYARWINDNFDKNDININPDLSLKSWERVNWDELNTIEEQIAADFNIQPTGFTHKLAPHGEQQYYEMIGKYSQFGSGWDDATAFTKADVIANGIGNVSQRFLDYAEMRAQANNYHNIATTVTYIILANHVLSALEAAWNASKINHRLKLRGHIQSRLLPGNYVEFVPTLDINYEL